MKKPLITVITPFYNNPHLFETIASVQAQNYEGEIQYIIINDASPVLSTKAVALYIRDHLNLTDVTLLENTENRGTVHSLNRAYRAAKGKYIFNIAGDDVFADEAVLTRWVDEFERTEADVITGKRVVYDENMEHILRLRPTPAECAVLKSGDSDRIFRRLFRKNFILGCATAYSAACLEQYGFFDESYRLIEDYPRVLALARQGAKFAFLDREVVHCRSGGTSSGSGFNKVYERDSDLVFHKEIKPYAKPLWQARAWYLLWKARQNLRKKLSIR